MNSVIHSISSDSAESGTSGNFVHKMQIPSWHNRISLLSIQVPKSFYLVQSGKNTFQLNSTTYTIPVGNYSCAQFVTAVNNLITPSTIAYAPLTGKMTISSSAATITIPSRLCRLFGLQQGTSSISAGTLVGTNVVNFTICSQLWLLSDVSYDGSIGAYSNTIYHINVNTSADMSYITWDNPDPRSTGKILTTFSGTQNRQDIFRTVEFRILDEDEAPVDFNGLDVSIVLLTFFEPPLLADMFKEFASVYFQIKQEERAMRQIVKP